MADISKIKPNGADGTEYDVKDATARNAIANKANNTQTFTEASTRTNIASGENMATLFGKIKKFFSDLKTVAFTGAYSDLSGRPTIPAAVAVKGNAESTYRTGNVNLTPANIGALPSNGTATAATKATQDGDGKVISTTYMKKGVDYVTAGKSSSSTLGSNATAEGDIVTASGTDSHAEGYNTQAIGYAAHAEGYRTVSGATGSNNYGAHAEGYVTKGTGYASHAEGLFTEAKGMGAHAEGYGTIARAYQHVEGQFNVEDTNNVYAHIIGGGSDDNNKKNIFTVSWDGDVSAGRSNGLTNDLKLPTGADVISYLNSNFGLFRFRGNGTLGVDVLATAKSLIGTGKAEILFYQNSNNPANQPSGCSWGSYLFISYNTNVTIIYCDRSHIACTYAVTSADTSIAWHIS